MLGLLLFFKKVSPQKCQTISQISLTSFFGKIFERIVKEKNTLHSEPRRCYLTPEKV